MGELIEFPGDNSKTGGKEKQDFNKGIAESVLLEILTGDPHNLDNDAALLIINKCESLSDFIEVAEKYKVQKEEFLKRLKKDLRN